MFQLYDVKLIYLLENFEVFDYASRDMMLGEH